MHNINTANNNFDKNWQRLSGIKEKLKMALNRYVEFITLVKLKKEIL